MRSSLLGACVLLASWNGLFAATYDLSKEKPPQGPLGVGLDYGFAKSSGDSVWSPRNWVYNSHIKFNGDVSTITDGQLVQIAMDGYKEIIAVQTQYNLNTRRSSPRVMSVLAVDKDIFIVSSQRGKASFMTEFGNTKVRESLERCQAMFAETAAAIEQPGHKNDASCGEVMAAHLFYSTYPEKNLADMKAVEVSVKDYDLADGKGKLIQVLDPCPGAKTVRRTPTALRLLPFFLRTRVGVCKVS